jgi:hypothetical protein
MLRGDYITMTTTLSLPDKNNIYEKKYING